MAQMYDKDSFAEQARMLAEEQYEEAQKARQGDLAYISHPEHPDYGVYRLQAPDRQTVAGHTFRHAMSGHTSYPESQAWKEYTEQAQAAQEAYAKASHALQVKNEAESAYTQARQLQSLHPDNREYATIISQSYMQGTQAQQAYEAYTRDAREHEARAEAIKAEAESHGRVEMSEQEPYETLPKPKYVRYTEPTFPKGYLPDVVRGVQPREPIGLWQNVGHLSAEAPRVIFDEEPYVDFSNITSRFFTDKGPNESILGIYLDTHGDIDSTKKEGKYYKTMCQLPPGMVLQKMNTAALGERGSEKYSMFMAHMIEKHGPEAVTSSKIALDISQTGNPRHLDVDDYMELFGNGKNLFYDQATKTLTHIDEGTGQTIKRYTKEDFSENCKTYTTKDFILKKNYDATPAESERFPLSFSISIGGGVYDFFKQSLYDEDTYTQDTSDAVIEARVDEFLTSFGINPNVAEDEHDDEGNPIPRGPDAPQLSDEQRWTLNDIFSNFLKNGFNTHDLIQLFMFFQGVFNCQYVSMMDASCGDAIDEEDIQQLAKIMLTYTSSIYGGKKTKKKKQKKIQKKIQTKMQTKIQTKKQRKNKRKTNKK